VPALSSLSQHQLLIFWSQLLVIVLVAVTLGRLLRRVGQPAVIGELLAGVLLGPSLLGKVWPGGFHWLFPSDAVQSGLLNAVGWLGVGFLLVLTGFEADLAIIRRLGRATAAIAVGGLALPFIVGLALGPAMPDTFLGHQHSRLAFSLFIAVSLAISSLPVIAKILGELGLMRRNFGQITVAVGMVNDLIGWVALGAIAGLARSGTISPGSVGFTLGAVAAILIFSFTVGQRAVDSLLRWNRGRTESTGDALAIVVIVALLAAVVTQGAKSDAVLGAFVAGIVLGRSRFMPAGVKERLESITMAVLAPIFFATAGLRIDLSVLGRVTTLLWAAVVLGVAVLTKLAGAFAGSRLARLERREALALGVGLNCRGAVEVVIATVGLSLGVLSESAYTAVVLMAVVTSMMAPPLLRRVVSGWRGTPEEQERLDREETQSRNTLVGPGRLLVPSRGTPNSIVAAELLHAAWPPEAGVTVLSVGADGRSAPLEPLTRIFEGREVEVRRARSDDVLAEVVAEARLGYGIIGLGAAENLGDGRILSPVVDDLLAESPVPLLIVRKGQRPALPRRVLVPVSGAARSRPAKEIAFNLSRRLGSEVTLVHVVTRPEPDRADVDATAEASWSPPKAHGDSGRTQSRAAVGVLEHAVTMADEHDVPASTTVRSGLSIGEEVIDTAGSTDADLVVVGATARRLEGRPFLGHTVEHVLEHAEATVVVVSMPDVASG
jgi:Kef-type K+ transport system membrane component KefB/nucleotide-binding universal stress UspA family protein